MATLHIQANTEVLGFYQKQKAEFHFQEKTDNEFLMFLLDTAVRVISIVQHLAPVIEAVSDASADASEDLADDENFESEFSTAAGSMEIDRINREVEDIIQLPPDPNPPLQQSAAKAIAQMPAQDTQFTLSTQQTVTLPTAQPAAQISLPPSSLPSQPVVSPAVQIAASQQQPSNQISTATVVAPKYSASISTSSVPVSISARDVPAASHPTSAPQSTSQPSTPASSDVNNTTTSRDTSSYSHFAPPPEEPEDNTMGEFKAEAVPEVVTIKDEPMSSSDHSTLLPQDTLHHLMSTLQSNEENIGVSNLVTTAQPSSLSSTFLDKTNNPLSMLTLSNTTSNINNLFPAGASDNLPGSSRSGELKSLMDSKAGASSSANPRLSIRPIPLRYRTPGALDSTTAVLCQYCGKLFSGSVAHLKRHIDAVHFKLRPFKCRFCEVCFSQNSARVTHERNIHKNVAKFKQWAQEGKE